MFTYVRANNYMSLNNIYLNLKETKDKTKKLAVVYGENGCGKTNLIKSFFFLESLIHTFDIEKNENELTKFLKEKGDGEDIPPFFMELVNRNTLSNLFINSRTIDCNENTRLEFGFEIEGHEGRYIVEFNDCIVYESLYYFTGKQSGIIFEVSRENIKNPKLAQLIFKSSKIKNEVKELIQRYWGRHSVLSIVNDLKKKLNKEYISDNISNYLYDFLDMIRETSISVVEANSYTMVDSCKKINFISDLEKGDVSSENEWLLKNTENILNDFFTQTYSDIKKVSFVTEKKDDRINYRLVFYKTINGKVREIPVDKESTGTRQVIKVLRSLFGAFCGCTVIIDEVDNGVHDLLLKVIIDSMKDYITGQLIFTTHNTSLLDSLDPKSVYIINSSYDGSKEIVCLSDYKLQDHNSPRARYMKGLYGGIPFVDSVDYIEIINNLKMKEAKNTR